MKQQLGHQLTNGVRFGPGYRDKRKVINGPKPPQLWQQHRLIKFISADGIFVNPKIRA